ncbi:hypothetical protein FQA47_011018 [Oryzias melastigma]|uniref:Uncharacterized protein n=1 Tax=Oryzias melastigma TaxID=30732 RepID=A0A834C4G4_ORYME|nr:hypothetical protein FQA47_011018 [Oryzias melastigma]
MIWDQPSLSIIPSPASPLLTSTSAVPCSFLPMCRRRRRALSALLCCLQLAPLQHLSRELSSLLPVLLGSSRTEESASLLCAHCWDGAQERREGLSTAPDRPLLLLLLLLLHDCPTFIHTLPPAGRAQGLHSEHTAQTAVTD